MYVKLFSNGKRKYRFQIGTYIFFVHIKPSHPSWSRVSYYGHDAGIAMLEYSLKNEKQEDLSLFFQKNSKRHLLLPIVRVVTDLDSCSIIEGGDFGNGAFLCHPTGYGIDINPVNRCVSVSFSSQTKSEKNTLGDRTRHLSPNNKQALLDLLFGDADSFYVAKNILGF